jgi:hypothetical protein
MFSDEPERATIVVCEDAEATLGLLCDHLTVDRYDCLPAPSAAPLSLQPSRPDAPRPGIAGHLGHGRPADDPGGDGIDARFNPQLPIIVLTARGDAGDQVRSLDLGADDYLQKPFLYEEVRARIAAILRRSHNRNEGPVRVGELLIDPGQGRRPRGPAVEERVHAVARPRLRPDRVFSKDELLRDVWGFTSPPKSTRTLDRHAGRLRRKLDPEHQKYVVDRWGIGYRLIDRMIRRGGPTALNLRRGNSVGRGRPPGPALRRCGAAVRWSTRSRTATSSSRRGGGSAIAFRTGHGRPSGCRAALAQGVIEPYDWQRIGGGKGHSPGRRHGARAGILVRSH